MTIIIPILVQIIQVVEVGAELVGGGGGGRPYVLR